MPGTCGRDRTCDHDAVGARGFPGNAGVPPWKYPFEDGRDKYTLDETLIAPILEDGDRHIAPWTRGDLSRSGGMRDAFIAQLDAEDIDMADKKARLRAVQVAKRQRAAHALEALAALHLEPESSNREIRCPLEGARNTVGKVLDEVRTIPFDWTSPGIGNFDARSQRAGARRQDILATFDGPLDRAMNRAPDFSGSGLMIRTLPDGSNTISIGTDPGLATS